jgi:hypothetical protein
MILRTLGTRLGAVGAVAALAGAVSMITPATSFAAQSAAHKTARPAFAGTLLSTQDIESWQDINVCVSGTVVNKAGVIRLRGCNSNEKWSFYQEGATNSVMLEDRAPGTSSLCLTDSNGNVAMRGCNVLYPSERWLLQGNVSKGYLQSGLNHSFCLSGSPSGEIFLTDCNRAAGWEAFVNLP